MQPLHFIRCGARASGSLVLIMLLLLLGACGTQEPEPDSPDSSPQRSPGVVQPQRTTTHEQSAITLPGRLLFVEHGVVWLWHGESGSRLFGSGEAWQPRWSPDGRQIVYIERGESYSNMMLADADGQLLKQMTDYGSDFPLHSYERIFDTMWAVYPAWSPDGTRIALISQASPPVGSPAVDYPLALYSMPSAGGPRMLLASEPGVHYGTVAYAPDGSQIVYARSAPGEGLSIGTFDPATSINTLLANVPPHSYDPAFSPDGRWLAFASRDRLCSDIWVMPIADDDDESDTLPLAPIRLTNLDNARAPVFSPDGTMMAFLAIPEGDVGFELWAIEITTTDQGTIEAGTPHQITQGMHIDGDSGLSWAE